MKLQTWVESLRQSPNTETGGRDAAVRSGIAAGDLAPGATVTPALFVSAGGRAARVVRHANADLQRLTAGQADFIRIQSFDLWRKDMDDDLPGVPRLPEACRIVAEPVVPADLADNIENDPDYEPVRVRISPQRFRSRTTSTAEGGGQNPAPALLATFLHERRIRESIGAALDEAARRAAAAGQLAASVVPTGYRFVSPNGAVGFGTLDYVGAMLRHLNPQITWVDVLLLTSELPSDSVEKARAQQHVALGKLLPFAASGRVFHSTEGPGGPDWSTQRPPADYTLALDPTTVHPTEVQALRGLGGLAALFPLGIGKDMLGILRNGQEDRIQEGRYLATAGCSVVEHDPAAHWTSMSLVYADSNLRDCLQAPEGLGPKAERRLREIVAGLLGDADRSVPIRWLERLARPTPLQAADQAANILAQRWVQDAPAGSPAQLRKTLEASRARFCAGLRNIASHAGEEAQRLLEVQLGAVLRLRVVQEVRRQQAEAFPQEAAALAVAALKWVQHAREEVEAQDRATAAEAEAETAMAAQEALPCPRDIFADAPRPSATANAPGAPQWWDRLIGLFLGSEETEEPEARQPALLPVAPPLHEEVVRWRATHIQLGCRWLSAALAAAVRRSAVAALQGLESDLQALHQDARRLLGEMAGAENEIGRKIAALQADFDGRSATTYFLPADDDLVAHELGMLKTNARWRDDVKAALARAADGAGVGEEIHRLTAAQIARRLEAVAQERTRFADRNLSEALPTWPASVLQSIAAVLRDTPVFARLRTGSASRPGVKSSHTIYAPEGCDAALQATDGLPLQMQYAQSPFQNMIVSFRFLAGLRWEDFECAKDCRAAHDGFGDRESLYPDERLMAVSDGSLSTPFLEELVVQYMAAGHFTWARHSFRLVPPGVPAKDPSPEQIAAMHSVADSLPRLLTAIRRGTLAPRRMEFAVREFEATEGRDAMGREVLDLVQGGRLTHPALKDAARRILQHRGVTPPADRPAAKPSAKAPAKRSGRPRVGSPASPPAAAAAAATSNGVHHGVH